MPATLPQGIRKGIAEFNRREFFESHETMEDVWAEESGATRTFYQGLIQAAIGCCHVQRGNYTGALNLLAGGQAKLQPFAPAREGVDVEALLAGMDRVQAALRRLGPGHVGEFDPALFPVITVQETS